LTDKRVTRILAGEKMVDVMNRKHRWVPPEKSIYEVRIENEDAHKKAKKAYDAFWKKMSEVK
jgi:hypothetical protein